MHNVNQPYDVLIVGAGPAGVSAALMLGDKKLSVAVVDKCIFPRDKICGDGLSADVVKQLYQLPDSVKKNFNTFKAKQPSFGVSFVAPSKKDLFIPFTQKNEIDAPGYVVKRFDFDYFLVNQLTQFDNIDVFEGETVTDIKRDDDGLKVKTTNHSFNARFLIGADGAHSIVSKKLTRNKLSKKHHCAGVRLYAKNVSGIDQKSFPIELQFHSKCLPGYFWIFPLPDNTVNVGLGILTSEVSKNKLNLKKILLDLIQNDPEIAPRFKEAELELPIQGFGLPLGSKKKQLSGDHFLLLGDAASLIDPFTGEGIANAIRSGRLAADHIIQAFKANQMNATFNKRYDRIVYQKMGNEFKISHGLQRMLNYPWLFNFVVKKAKKNESLRKLISSMLDNIDIKKDLVKPSFYIKLLFT